MAECGVVEIGTRTAEFCPGSTGIICMALGKSLYLPGTQIIYKMKALKSMNGFQTCLMVRHFSDSTW